MRRLAWLTLACSAPSAFAAATAPVRYETERATLYFEAGQLTPREMARFVAFADQGIADIEAYLGGGEAAAARAPERVTFKISSEFEISRAYRGTIFLPLDRVRNDSAPYLHETAHVLLPTRCRCHWLSEGFASYVQAYVSEHLGGYDGVIFSQGGNANVDRLAGGYLTGPRGRAVLPYVGLEATPPRLDEDRRGVAAPFYVLSHSFVKYLVERLGLERVKRLHDAADPARELETRTGRPLDWWRDAWLTHVGEPGV
jgi:hypothetical protein